MSTPYSVLTLEGGVWGPRGPNRKGELLWERPRIPKLSSNSWSEFLPKCVFREGFFFFLMKISFEDPPLSLEVLHMNF